MFISSSDMMVRLAEGDYKNGRFAVRYKNKVGLGRRERNRWPRSHFWASRPSYGYLTWTHHLVNNIALRESLLPRMLSRSDYPPMPTPWKSTFFLMCSYCAWTCNTKSTPGWCLPGGLFHRISWALILIFLVEVPIKRYRFGIHCPDHSVPFRTHIVRSPVCSTGRKCFFGYYNDDIPAYFKEINRVRRSTGSVSFVPFLHKSPPTPPEGIEHEPCCD